MPRVYDETRVCSSVASPRVSDNIVTLSVVVWSLLQTSTQRTPLAIKLPPFKKCATYQIKVFSGATQLINNNFAATRTHVSNTYTKCALLFLLETDVTFLESVNLRCLLNFHWLTNSRRACFNVTRYIIGSSANVK